MQGLAHRLRTGCKLIPPQPVADDCRGSAMRTVFQRREFTAQGKLYAQRGKEAGSDLHAIQMCRSARTGEGIIAPGGCCRAFERADTAPPVLKIRIGNIDMLDIGAALP